ncbi:hypothetical protein [Streptomyces sp. NPDC018352]
MLRPRQAMAPDSSISSVGMLHDIHGPVGQAEQILTVRPQPHS